MLPEEYKSQIFDEIYDNVYRNTMRIIENNPEFKMKNLEALIDTESNRLGNSWDVGGSVNEIGISATLAAYESILAIWKDGAIDK